MRKLLPIILLFTTFTIYAQRPQEVNPIKITGTVLEQDTNQPLEYATLVLQSIDNPSKISGGITDANGKYEVEAQPGKYNVSIEYIGYKTFKLPNQNLTKSIDLG